MSDVSKYYGKYMDNESFCCGQKPFIHMHLDNIIRDIRSSEGLVSDIDYILQFSENSADMELILSADMNKDVLKKFSNSVKSRILLLAQERYPIVYDQPDANRAHDFYINLSNYLDVAKLSQNDAGDHQITVHCDY